MARLDWKSEAHATVIRRLPKGNGRSPERHRRGKILKPALHQWRGFFRARSSASAIEIPVLTSTMRGDMRALLALEDGRHFEGESFGATGTRIGEICFNTAMTGYQEVLTDPSYRGQIVAMTYPLIGNYGTNSLDQESRSPHVRGFVIEE